MTSALSTNEKLDKNLKNQTKPKNDRKPQMNQQNLSSNAV